MPIYQIYLPLSTALEVATENPKKAIETIINDVSIPSKDIKTKKDKKTKLKDKKRQKNKA
jgi:hypothetical protein